jgi:hypothetical protein
MKYMRRVRRSPEFSVAKPGDGIGSLIMDREICSSTDPETKRVFYFNNLFEVISKLRK